MNRVIAALSTLMMSFAMLMMTSSPAEATVECQIKTLRTEHNNTYGVQWGLAHYKTCKNYDTNRYWVKPLKGVGGYNMEGEHMSCGSFNRKYDGVRLNFFNTETTDNMRAHNPPSFVVPCDESTINRKEQDWSDAPRLYFGDFWAGFEHPKSQLDLTVMLNLYPDKHYLSTRWFKPYV